MYFYWRCGNLAAIPRTIYSESPLWGLASHASDNLINELNQSSWSVFWGDQSLPVSSAGLASKSRCTSIQWSVVKSIVPLTYLYTLLGDRALLPQCWTGSSGLENWQRTARTAYSFLTEQCWSCIAAVRCRYYRLVVQFAVSAPLLDRVPWLQIATVVSLLASLQ